MRLLYKPLGIVLGIVASKVSVKLFDRAWAAIDDDAAPAARAQDAGWRKALTAATLHALIFAGVRTAIDRGGATVFRNLTGAWPDAKGTKPLKAPKPIKAVKPSRGATDA